MFSNRKTVAGTVGTSVIAKGVTVRGDVEFTGALHLDGTVEGAVLADAGSEAVFTLSDAGRVCGEVRVPHAVINGEIKGDIHASARLELAASACVEGDVHYHVLEMVAGAEVNGRMVHETHEPKQLPRPQVRQEDGRGEDVPGREAAATAAEA